MIHNARNKLSNHGDKIIPFSIDKTETGECVSFNHREIINLLLHTCKLDTISRTRSMNLSLTSDSACITNNMHQFVVGLKIIDASAIDSLTNKLMWPRLEIDAGLNALLLGNKQLKHM